MRTYKQHYLECKNRYGPTTSSVYNLTIMKDVLVFDENNFSIMKQKISDRLKNSSDCIEDKWSVKLNYWKDILELERFCEEVMPQIEEGIFGSYLKVEHIHPYKNKTNATLESSWVWHYDDCPKEYIKLAVYLNDVDRTNGCMQIIIDKDKGIPVVDTYRLDPTAIKGHPPPVFPRTRIPKHITERMSDNGAQFYNLEGRSGSHFIFTPNIMHRGTIPSGDTAPREAIFFFLRPSLEKVSNYTRTAHPFSPEKNVKKYELD